MGSEETRSFEMFLYQFFHVGAGTLFDQRWIRVNKGGGVLKLCSRDRALGNCLRLSWHGG